ncbi:MAG: hypothetical protein H6625_00600 [Bdellovibrionaceae bacterium]|nr:hypothetical protein [Pseudobdellovibrionaceae bacterium]
MNYLKLSITLSLYVLLYSNISYSQYKDGYNPNSRITGEMSMIIKYCPEPDNANIEMRGKPYQVVFTDEEGKMMSIICYKKNNPYGTIDEKGGETDSDSAILKECGATQEETKTKALKAAKVEECKKTLAEAEDCAQRNTPGIECKSDNEAKTADEETDGDSSDTASYTEEELKKAVEECKRAKQKASQCCGPGGLGCLVGADPGEGGETIAAVGGMLVQTLIASRQLQGMQQNCDSQEGLANFGAGLNGAMAVSCHTSRSSCESTCQQLEAPLQASMKSECETTACQRKYKIMLNEVQSHIKSCDKLVQNEVAMGTQAGVTLVSTSQMAKLCQEVIAASPPPVAPGIPGNDLCNDPSDLSNPYCRQQFCTQPGTSNAPECQGINPIQAKVGGGSGSSNFSNSFGSKGSLADLSGANNDEGQPQLPGTQAIEIGERKASQTQAGQGGGLPGAPGGGGGGDSGYDTAGGTAKGLNTNVLSGLASGNGYSVSASNFQGGGGYSNPVGGGGDDKKKPFDLKKFLPNKAPPQRKLAGLSGPKDSLAGQLAGKHENIFTRVSNKYKEMCILNRLMCDSKK